jgi:hypothetical protein
MLLKLPVEIMPSFIQPYLKATEYKHVMDTCNYWKELKYLTMYLVLPASMSYCIFHENAEPSLPKLYSMVKDRSKQIKLNLSYFSDIHILSPVVAAFNALTLCRCKNLACIECLRSVSHLSFIDLSHTKVTDLTPLEGKFLSHLILSNTLVVEVNCLKNVRSLNLRGCPVKHVSELGNVRYLNLSHCTKLTDVSALGNVYDLDLTDCQQLTDVSALTNNHILKISFCKLIIDISTARNSYYLDISHCSGIQNLDFVKSSSIRVLKVTGCSQFRDSDQPTFSSLKKLVI